MQPRGTAFYNVGKRGGRKLRIETPFLVGVVKGTQFNVVAQDDATTISLFEGLLEVRSADDSDVVDLHAGEIASRDRAATDISRPEDGCGRDAAACRQAPATQASRAEFASPKAPRPAARLAATSADAMHTRSGADDTSRVIRRQCGAASISAARPSWIPPTMQSWWIRAWSQALT